MLEYSVYRQRILANRVRPLYGGNAFRLEQSTMQKNPTSDDLFTLWQKLEIAQFAEEIKLIGEEDNIDAAWAKIALASVRQASAEDVFCALEKLKTRDPSEKRANLTIKDWINLGDKILSNALLRANATKLAKSFLTSPHEAFFFSSLMNDALTQIRSEKDALPFVKKALDEYPNDPLAWYECSMLLCRLSVAARDDNSLNELISFIENTYPEIDFLRFIKRQYGFELFAQKKTAQAFEVLNDFRQDPLIKRWINEDIIPELIGNIKAHRPAKEIAENIEEEYRLLKQLKNNGSSSIKTLANIRHAIDPSETSTALLRLNEENLVELLNKGARLFVQEERPIKIGFAEILAFCPNTKLLYVDLFRRPGSEWRTWNEQEFNMALYGNMALVVFDKKDKLPVDKYHNENLDLLNQAEEMQDNPQQSRARKEKLASQAVSACPDIPRAWQLHGQALLEQLKAHELDENTTDGALERWYAKARHKFEHAEWAHQIYAQMLEHWHLYEEAAIAWSDASTLDPYDVRNLIGIARTRIRENLIDAALPFANDALIKKPETIDAWLLRAELASHLNEKSRDFLIDVLLEIAADNPEVDSLASRRAEKDQDLEKALIYIDQAIAKGKISELGWSALIASRLGYLDGALMRAHRALEEDPNDPFNHIRVALLFFSLGQSQNCLDALEFALSRCGPHPSLVAVYAKRLSDLLEKDILETKVKSFIHNWAEHIDALIQFGIYLSESTHIDLALESFSAAKHIDPNSLNTIWQEAQNLMRHQRHQDAKTILDQVFSETPLPHAHCLILELGTEDEYETIWKNLSFADANQDPALVWICAHYLANKQNDETSIKELDSRINQLPLSLLIEGGFFLTRTRAITLAEYMIERIKSHPKYNEGNAEILSLEALFAGKNKKYKDASEKLFKAHQEENTIRIKPFDLNILLKAKNSEALSFIANAALKIIKTGAPEDFGDGLLENAYIEAVEALTGNSDGLEQLIHRYPNHPLILKIGFETALLSGANKKAKEYQSQLTAIAPGLLNKTKALLKEEGVL